MKKIGILGGTFDPIHKAHLAMALAAKEQYALDEVWMMPDREPPHKFNESLTTAGDRLAMVKLAVQSFDGLVASDYELRRTGMTYTSDTLTQLHQEYPDVQWFFIIGGDSLMHMQNWVHPEIIYQYAEILYIARSSEAAIYRAHAEELMKTFPGSVFHEVKMDLYPVSSSMIRASVLEGERDPERLHILPEVYQYIREHRLYQESGKEMDEILSQKNLLKLEKEMRDVLPFKRYRHSLGVADTAACLAFVHGADEKKARLAGILHDCAKYLSDDELLKICRKNQIAVTKNEEKKPDLLHAKVGAHLANTIYGVTDREVLSAIRYHTTGRPEMSLLEKIIFVADYIEPTRKDLPNFNMIRRTAFTDLDTAVFLEAQGTLEYLKEKSAAIDPATTETFVYYSKKAKMPNAKKKE